MKLSLQLYSVHQETEQDFSAVLKKARSAGYSGVEFAGCGSYSALEMRQLLEENGLYSAGAHIPREALEDRIEQELAYHQVLGTPYLVVPTADFACGLEDVDRLAETLNLAAQKAAGSGIRVGYHNHDQEFARLDGRYILDLLAERTDRKVILEVDVYWAQKAGADPIALIQKYAERVELIHLRQMNEAGLETDLPDGIIDIPAVIRAASFAKGFVVEQEEFSGPAWESLKRNVEYVEKYF